MNKNQNLLAASVLDLKPCKLVPALNKKETLSEKFLAFRCCFHENMLLLRFKVRKYVTYLSIIVSVIRARN